VLRRLKAALHHDLCTQFLEQKFEFVKTGGILVAINEFHVLINLLTTFRNSEVKKKKKVTTRVLMDLLQHSNNGVLRDAGSQNRIQ
jgi:hypothetical protein